jgi:hypothetical protein
VQFFMRFCAAGAKNEEAVSASAGSGFEKKRRK